MKNKMQLSKQTFAIFCFSAAALLGDSGRAQGVVDFHNTGTTQITTNSFSGATGPIAGSGNYLFGLYVGPLGSSMSSLSPIGLTTNISLPGLFGTSGNFIALGFPAGTPLSFQVRGWSAFAGTSFEQASVYASGASIPIAYLGVSAPGFFTVPSSGSVVLFGTGPGQVGGFALTPIPEPSVALLGLLGGLAFCTVSFSRKRDRETERNDDEHGASYGDSSAQD